ncbi:hypothetical protein FVEN_g3705 [Fusarium venenatum]|uniref:Uncharacterized protein n=1 Tax=Fusarium venenatum TaxID=56646 RepID=A0A2L2SRP8_9HYPO|nr:uncharacterized protein FVRRES_13667 [Fusarium venenatum]KAG8358673.1 hypothetical protein FVEN_g3705 [Fusarium venenatum]CEI41629.1 unnamed protein product [Fusarium venenatum]
MRLFHLLPMLGLVCAAPAEADYPMTLDKRQTPPPPTRPLPQLPTNLVNITWCQVTITQNPGLEVVKAHTVYANLYMVDGIASPGTKNGANPYDFFVSTGSSLPGGGIIFAKNKYVMSLPYQLGPVNNDFARMRLTDDGYIVANVDYSNLDNAATKTPLSFNAEMRISSGSDKNTYNPPTPYRLMDGFVGFRVKDNIVDGKIQITKDLGGNP